MSTRHPRSTGTSTQNKSKSGRSGNAVKLKGFPGPGPAPIPGPGQGQGAPPGGAPQPLQAIQQAGQFAIMIGNNFVTAVDGGGRTTDVLHTNAVDPKAWEKFSLWYVPLTGEYGIQTVGGQFLSATNGGGLDSLFPINGEEVDTIESTATQIIDYERFRFHPLTGFAGVLPIPTFGIETVRGFWLTAVGGGGLINPPVFYTDSVPPIGGFSLLKSGDPGSGYTYGITVATQTNPALYPWLDATDGGGQSISSVPNAMPLSQ